MNLDEIELHDALLKGMHVDFASGRISVAIEYYETANSPQRTVAVLEFEGVESISQIIDCARLEKNAFAGNVSFWAPEATEGTTYIYLTGGCIAVKARQLCFTKPAR